MSLDVCECMFMPVQVFEYAVVWEGVCSVLVCTCLHCESV